MIEHSFHRSGVDGTAIIPGTLMRALVIDPYQRKVHPIHIGSDRSSWRKALSGTPIGPVILTRNRRGTRSLLLLASEEASTKKPLPPQSRIQPGEEERPILVTGYGLVLSADVGKGKWFACRWSSAKFSSMIWWERWEHRLDPADYFAELTRNPDCWLKS